MVYMGNIINAIDKIDEEQELVLNFKSGKQSTVKSTDKVNKVNGDLIISRYNRGNWICTIYVDCAEVESMIIKKRMVI